MSKTTLSQASSGDRCLVLDIAPEPAELRSRLYSLGIIPGSVVKLLRLAPLGDPMQLKVGGSFVSIRKSEAEIISVEIQ
ncbi:MAG: ferrous iron transport protein A [Gammaproteobacteria bacterium]|jgi:ferrous iron transport protein A|nr:ferrous iron transport protein A [Gammaproteobacteria bacterium]MBT3859239.1 ferrous iron transport protein A [Gammaproteobacteria bacterium]MBT3988107.1 ferrous iron transport protein A [Gammaproteobacteria bacterium]MBT4256670.1 ferrous iron transport protein A [Gammaproteobacteria bacterium]MBT4583038.1 ferrous iron transport protein A [Gammaproteobacteria bacterium]